MLSSIAMYEHCKMGTLKGFAAALGLVHYLSWQFVNYSWTETSTFSGFVTHEATEHMNSSSWDVFWHKCLSSYRLSPPKILILYSNNEPSSYLNQEYFIATLWGPHMEIRFALINQGGEFQLKLSLIETFIAHLLGKCMMEIIIYIH